ncbi:unnamed protein product [Hydatigera taeniaeformis]|uniref:Uncharacterized protein n=1 Tax=Hydatigena taeniaeformis TaxID=6205 RepID=A0A0R3XA46_HYDTA|nr:unnamed protein product [Hydatigera taeniaeformis]
MKEQAKGRVFVPIHYIRFYRHYSFFSLTHCDSPRTVIAQAVRRLKVPPHPRSSLTLRATETIADCIVTDAWKCVGEGELADRLPFLLEFNALARLFTRCLRSSSTPIFTAFPADHGTVDESRPTNQILARVQQVGWCCPDISSLAFTSAEASAQRQQRQHHLQQVEESRERRVPITSSPLKMGSLHPPSALKGRITTNGTVTMPFFGTSPEPEDLTDNSWFRGPPSNHNGSRSSLSTQKCNPRSTVRIQCDSGIEAGNHCSNDVQESSLDDGRIESLPDCEFCIC